MLAFGNYLNPNLLWLGLGALAPIIIHLAARSRPKVTPFPAVRFILASHRKSSAKFKLKQLLLLLLRCAALGLFAFLVARPWTKGTVADVQRTKATVTAVVLLDTSYSMGHRQADKTALQSAKEMAVATVDAFTEGKSRACLLLVGSTPRPVISDFEHAYELDALKKHIEDARSSYTGTNCTLAVKEAIRMLKQANGVGKSIFLFTDMTAQAWPGPVPASGRGEDITIYVADVGADNARNPAVLGVKAPSAAAAGAPFEVRARVDAVGSAGQQVKLVIDGAKAGGKTANAERVEEIPIIASAGGAADEHWGAVSLAGHDDLEVDNSYSFTFRSSATVKVTLVNGAPASVRRRDELFYLRTGLAPGGTGAGGLVGLSEIRPNQIEVAQLAGSDVLVLCNVAALPTAAWTKVRHFVSTGHGLIVFGGDQVQAANYAPLAQGEAPLLPCVIGQAVTPSEPTRFEPGQLKHPILRKFQGGRNGDLAEAKFRTYLALSRVADAPHQTVLAFKNDAPALVAGRYGEGKVLVFASSCDQDWNSFPQQGQSYVVLMHEAVRFLVSSAEEKRDVTVGSAPTLRITNPDTVRHISLTRLPKGAGDPAADVTARFDKREGRLNLAPVAEPGVYVVDVERTMGRGNESLFFAANLETAESNLERLATDEASVKSLLPGRTVHVARTQAQLLDQISRSESVSELSSHLAGLMLAILLAEMYLANHMRSRVRSVEEEEE